jgi:hypothetical protein
MTALCAGGGSSSLKPGADRYIYMGGAALGALLNNIPTPWAVPLAALIGAATYDLQTICSSDPPGYPTFDTLDVLALTVPGGTALYPASAQKWRDLIHTALWYAFCQCDAGAQPTEPAGPAEPADIPDLGPGLTNTGPNLPCNSKSGTGDHVLQGTSWKFFPWGDYRFTEFRLKLPPGTTHYRITATHIPAGSVHSAIQVNINEVTLPSAAVGFTTTLFTLASGQTNSVVVTPTNSSIVEVIPFGYATDTAGEADDLLFAQLEIFCGGSPTATIGPCCPADQYVVGLLQQILSLVTLVQRQAAPFGYIAGAQHVGLSGNGEIAVQGLLGVLLELTTIPAWVGVDDGTPDVLFDAGWINWGNADGYSSRELLRAESFLSLPAAAGQYTKLAYSLSSGVVATITELEREP